MQILGTRLPEYTNACGSGAFVGGGALWYGPPAQEPCRFRVRSVARSVLSHPRAPAKNGIRGGVPHSTPDRAPGERCHARTAVAGRDRGSRMGAATGDGYARMAVGRRRRKGNHPALGIAMRHGGRPPRPRCRIAVAGGDRHARIAVAGPRPRCGRARSPRRRCTPPVADVSPPHGSMGNEASWQGPTGRESAQLRPSREFFGNGVHRAGAAGGAAGGARGFRGRANWWYTTPPLIKRQGVLVHLRVGGLYGTDLRSANLAVFACATVRDGSHCDPPGGSANVTETGSFPCRSRLQT